MAKSKPKKPNTIPLIHPAQLELVSLLQKVRGQAHDENLAVKDVERNTQSIIDQVDILAPLVPYMPPQVTEGFINIVGAASDQLARYHFVFSQAAPSTGTAGGTLSLSTTSVMRAYGDNQLSVQAEGFQAAWQPYLAYTSRPSERDTLLQLFKEFGLDVSHRRNEKSALELLNTAHEAFEKPVTPDNPISTSLIPLRGSVEVTVKTLISMRPVQEEANSWKKKIRSIGAQLKNDVLPSVVVDEWADECDALINDLSDAKIGEMERDKWLVSLNRGTAFLISLLKGLDSRKLAHRKPSS